MSVLDKKLRRDLWQMRGPLAAIGLVLACAVVILVGAMGTHQALRRSRDAYYVTGRFGDLFSRAGRVPVAVAEHIAALPGVRAAEPRIVTLVPMVVNNGDASAAATLISLPHTGVERLNLLSLAAGRRPTSAWEAVASQAFFDAADLRLGESVEIIIAGRCQSIRLVGVGLSPELIYTVRPGEMMPDDANYGVLWLDEGVLAAALGMNGSFNDLVVSVAPGAGTDDLVASIDGDLGPYGGTGTYGRHDHVSHRFLSDDIDQLAALAVFLPAVFFGIAAYLVSLVLGRLVASQRQQIATLKALGFTNSRVALYYVEVVTVVVLAAVAAGAAGGTALARALSGFYAHSLYRLPTLVHETPTIAMAAAAILALVAAYLGVGNALAAATRLAPAEAMRPPPPASFRQTWIERAGVHRWLSQSGRIVLRNLERHPVRALSSACGIAFAVALVISAGFATGAIGMMVDLQLRQAERQDATVAFATPRPESVRFELARLPGVLEVELFRATPIRLHAGHHSYRTTLHGLDPAGTLRQVIDRQGRVRPLPASGLLLTAELAEILGVEPGDEVRVDVLEGRRPTRIVRVGGLADEALGVAAYTLRPQLAGLVDDSHLVSGARLRLDPRHSQRLVADLRAMPAVAGVSLQQNVIEAFERLTGGALVAFAAVLVAFAIAMLVGVVFNAARVLWAERERELTTLRVLGFTRGELAVVLFGELGAQVAVAIPLGWLAGYGLAALVCAGMESDLVRMPLWIPAPAYLLAAAITVVTTVAICLSFARRLGRLDLLSVLKTAVV